MKKRNLLVYLFAGCVLTASMSAGTVTAVHAETDSAAAVEPGTNMYAAGEVTFNAPVSGTLNGMSDYHWYSFTTGAAGTEYQISCINGTQGSGAIWFGIYDEMGTELYTGEAMRDGRPSVIAASDLQEDTTYYIQLVETMPDTADYVLTVNDPTAPASEIASAGEELVPGESMYNAGAVPFGKKASGTLNGMSDYDWYFFSTEATEGAEYQISCVNATPRTGSIRFVLCDEMGTELYAGEAAADGKPSTITAGDLQADTTYYVRLDETGPDEADYILMIKAPKADDKKAAPADGTAAAEEQTQAATADAEASEAEAE